jgi:protein gp37
MLSRLESSAAQAAPTLPCPRDLTFLTERAERIRVLGKRVIGDVIEIGRLLIECRERCSHGHWLAWLEAEFGWTDRTALNFMRVYELSLKSETVSDLDLPMRSLYLLAAPSTTESARTEVIERANGGERLEHVEVREIIAAHSPAAVHAAAPGAWTQDQLDRKTQAERGICVVATMRKIDGRRRDEALLAWAEAEGRLVRIDRPSEFGNPYESPRDGTRAEVVEQFANKYWPHEKRLFDQTSKLAGKVLACWCYPDQCHGDVIAKTVNRPATLGEHTEDGREKGAPMLWLPTHTGELVPYPQPKGEAKFNRQTNDQISWAAWTWNPVTGCLHGCRYCYARELATSPSYAQTYPAGFTPLFHHERLDAPRNTKIPEQAKTDPLYWRVFVCSMADLYGKWVPDEWIERVHQSCIDNPQWEYLFLTKFPRRYVGLNLPPTAWIGTSVDEQKRVRLAEEAFRQIKDVRVKWLSLEPLREPLEFTDLSMFDWIVIGAQSATNQPDGHVPAFAPPIKWVMRLMDQARRRDARFI